MLRSSLLVLAVLVAAVVELPAQQAPPLEANQRVRVSTATAQEVGWVEEVTQDTLAIWRAYGLGELRMPLARIERLEISRGYAAPGARILASGGIGLLVGVGAGAAVGYAAGDNPPCTGWDTLFTLCGITAREKATFFGVLGALSGALAGGVIGAVAAPEERWERVALPAQVGVAPLRDGVAVVVSRPF